MGHFLAEHSPAIASGALFGAAIVHLVKFEWFLAVWTGTISALLFINVFM